MLAHAPPALAMQGANVTTTDRDGPGPEAMGVPVHGSVAGSPVDAGPSAGPESVTSSKAAPTTRRTGKTATDDAASGPPSGGGLQMAVVRALAHAIDHVEGSGAADGLRNQLGAELARLAPVSGGERE